VLAAEPAVFAEFQLGRLGFFVFGCGVVSLLALGAAKRDDVSHMCILCFGLWLRSAAASALVEFIQ
jgi:hypothetical protein